ncbi:MAG TPA: ATP-binding protein [Micromonosporaceae bacterium]
MVQRVTAGEPGSSVLADLVDTTREVLGAAGGTFVEVGAGGGRVVAATGVMRWALGRSVDVDARDADSVLGRSGIHTSRPDAMPSGFAALLRAHGVEHIVAVGVELGDRVIGTLYLFFVDEPVALPAQWRDVLGFVGATMAHLYRDRRGLPVYGDLAAASQPSEAVVLVDADGTVRGWNRPAAALVGIPADRALGGPLPVPVPSPGRSTEHRTRDGRLLRVSSTDLAGTECRVVTLRDVTGARRRDEAGELFLALTGHELRTPVTVIKGYADTLADHWDALSDGDRREAVHVLRERADDLARLLERLLTAAEDYADDREAVPFDLADTVRQSVADLPRGAGDRLLLDLAGEAPTALGDPAGTATVVAELVTNAVKYSRPGTPIEVTIFVEQRTVGLRVADRGIGIRPEHVERAFDRFWQAESGDQRRYGGVGLGLYLVRRIVERQNGWVSLRARDGGGTVAEVRLPRADVMDTVRRPPAGPAPVSGEA